MKIQMLIIMVLLLVSGCGKDIECPVCETCTTPEPIKEIVYINQTIEKIVNNTIIKEVSKDCDKTIIENLTKPYFLQIKSCNRQLENCLDKNESYYNGTREDECTRCEWELNKTQYLLDELNNILD